MTFCAIKVCRNYKRRTKTASEVTYHRIPTDPIVRSRWVDIIRKSHGEAFWTPTKTTVVCSDHFHLKYLYFVGNQKRRRLKKEAVPSKAIILSSLESDDSENADDTENADETENAYETENADENVQPSTSKIVLCADTSPLCSSHTGNVAILTKENSDIIEDFSDLDSVFDSPSEAKLRKDLRKKIRIQQKHRLKIQSLRKKNLRLQKKLASFKQIIDELKKERYIKDDTHDVLCSNCKYGKKITRKI
ncbi:hypothetical protein K1T71_003712 [Dendrolimus kikuchii]|uniref:Uncharacterized protein n=1 Tax=Dendrolimus kikuchii TaxID=765133 RepID=A0ACC1D8N5_9NEOP|nr:hypothetical protein K1T71_003712 [Dendrolimus kikuchii]